MQRTALARLTLKAHSRAAAAPQQVLHTSTAYLYEVAHIIGPGQVSVSAVEGVLCIPTSRAQQHTSTHRSIPPVHRVSDFSRYHSLCRALQGIECRSVQHQYLCEFQVLRDTTSGSPALSIPPPETVAKAAAPGSSTCWRGSKEGGEKGRFVKTGNWIPGTILLYNLDHAPVI